MSEMEKRCARFKDALKGEPYASIVPARTPELKHHGSIGRAKSAVAYSRLGEGARGGEIYRRTAEGWELVYRVEKDTPYEELPWRTS